MNVFSRGRLGAPFRRRAAAAAAAQSEVAEEPNFTEEERAYDVRLAEILKGISFHLDAAELSESPEVITEADSRRAYDAIAALPVPETRVTLDRAARTHVLTLTSALAAPSSRAQHELQGSIDRLRAEISGRGTTPAG